MDFMTKDCPSTVSGWHFFTQREDENHNWFKECDFCHQTEPIDSNYEYDDMSQERN